MRVSRIHFNHDPSAQSGALNLRRDDNPGSIITEAEWKDGRQIRPIAYAKNAVVDPVVVMVTFAGGPPGETAEIEALEGTLESHLEDRERESPLPLPADARLRPVERPRPSATLGGLARKNVSFGPTGESQPVPFKVTGRMADVAVGKLALDWSWIARINPNRPWLKFAVTQVDVCIALDMPNPPWTNDPTDGWSLPWPEAMARACAWAAGANTVQECVIAIAEQINANSLHHYEQSDQYVAIGSAEFGLKEYIADLDSGVGFTMNCRDTVSALISFANLLGANLWPLSLSARFTTHAIRTFAQPGAVSHGFTFHEVAVPKGMLPFGFPPEIYLALGVPPPLQIYDAMVRLPVDTLPLAMVFGNVASAGTYCSRLIQPGTIVLPVDSTGELAKPRHQRKVI